MKEKHHSEQDKAKHSESGKQEDLKNEVNDIPEHENQPGGAEKKMKGKAKEHELKQKYDELNDKYLRLYSDFDNYRKRTIKEKVELQKNATEDLVVDLLNVVDDFERAITAFGKHQVDEETVKGVELIYNKLIKILDQKGLSTMKIMGEDFNTDFHEAITNIPAPSAELKGKVLDVVQKGYILNGKIIRFAKVVVGI